MVEVFYKGSKYRYYKSQRNRHGSWICEEGRCLGQLMKLRGISVPVAYWGELRVAAIDAGYSADDFAPLAQEETKKKASSKKKSDRPTISIF